MGKDTYNIDSHKLMYHPERVAQWFTAKKKWYLLKKVYPLSIEISPVNYCNHCCAFCALDYINQRAAKTSIPFPLLKKRLQEMAHLGVKSIVFAGEGEPTLYKFLPEIISWSDSLGLGVGLTTNMVPFTEKSTRVFVKHCKWIKVSINAGTASAYAKIQGTNPDDFQRVLANMQRAVFLREKYKSQCVLGVQILLLPDNVHTVTKLIEKVKKIGFDYIVIKPYSQHQASLNIKYSNIDYSKYLGLQKKFSKYQSKTFQVVFREETMQEIIAGAKVYAQCWAVPFFGAYVAATGDVYGCLSFLGNRQFCIGNIIRNSFQSIWESSKRKMLFSFVQDKLNPHQCKKHCRFDKINGYLSRIMSPEKHDAFV